MIAIVRREDGPNLCRFREDRGDVRATHVHKREIDGVTQSLTVSEERIAGRIALNTEGWVAHVFNRTPSDGGLIYSFRKLGVFADRRDAVEAIVAAFEWQSDAPLLQHG